MSVTTSVMVVDDDTDIREGVRDLLEAKGYAVLTAANGLEALALLQKGARPDVILLDLMMPVMDGYQFAAEQHKSATFGQIPILVLTADGHASQKAASVHADGFVQKPFKTNVLLECLARFHA